MEKAKLEEYPIIPTNIKSTKDTDDADVVVKKEDGFVVIQAPKTFNDPEMDQMPRA